MSDKFDYLTVVLEKPISEEYADKLCEAIKCLQCVIGVEKGKIDMLESYSEKLKLRSEIGPKLVDLFLNLTK